MFEGLASIFKYLFGFIIFAIFFGLFGEGFNDNLNTVIININNYVLRYIDTMSLILIILLLVAVIYRYFFGSLRK